ncbi:MAG TPA: hypothetical protein VKW04_20240 [Planctomycetota bacterium]|nr:hypothetical protein [Planctomycetota bacterium]
MRRLFALPLLVLLALAAGCQEPPKTAQMDDRVTQLCNLHLWDRYMQAKGNVVYDSVMSYGPEIWPILVDHLADETPTAIEDEMSGRIPKVCDVALLMLLELTKKRWEEFSADGLFISTALPNPIFCIKWDREGKLKVRQHFRQYFLEHPPEK